MAYDITTEMARQTLLRLGFTPLGARQILGGQIVVAPADRSRLADLIMVALGDGSLRAKRIDEGSPLIVQALR